jgi:hypothetical protein
MATVPTYEDANLVVQLAQWATALGVNEAFPAIMEDDFDPEIADALNDTPVRTMLTFFETVGTLVKNDVLNRELVRDWLWVEGVWTRVEPAALAARERLHEPRLYENFEALAKG